MSDVRWPFRRGKVKPIQPLPKRIEEVAARLEVVRSRLETRVRELEARDKILFKQVVDAQASGDKEKAAAYANELSEVRRMTRRALRSQLTLEGLIHRLRTLKDLDELGDSVAPLREVIQMLGGDVRGVAPTISEEIRRVMDALEEFSIEVGGVPEAIQGRPSLDRDAEKILEEASEIARRRVGREPPEA